MLKWDKSFKDNYYTSLTEYIRLFSFQSEEVINILSIKDYYSDMSKCREKRNYSLDINQLNGINPIWAYSPAPLETKIKYRFNKEDLYNGELFQIFRCEMSLEENGLSKFYLIEFEIEANKVRLGLTHNSSSLAVVIPCIEKNNVIGIYKLNYDEHWYYPKVTIINTYREDACFTRDFKCSKNKNMEELIMLGDLLVKRKVFEHDGNSLAWGRIGDIFAYIKSAPLFYSNVKNNEEKLYGKSSKVNKDTIMNILSNGNFNEGEVIILFSDSENSYLYSDSNIVCFLIEEDLLNASLENYGNNLQQLKDFVDYYSITHLVPISAIFYAGMYMEYAECCVKFNNSIGKLKTPVIWLCDTNDKCSVFTCEEPIYPMLDESSLYENIFNELKGKFPAIGSDSSEIPYVLCELIRGDFSCKFLYNRNYLSFNGNISRVEAMLPVIISYHNYIRTKYTEYNTEINYLVMGGSTKFNTWYTGNREDEIKDAFIDPQKYNSDFNIGKGTGFVPTFEAIGKINL